MRLRYRLLCYSSTVWRCYVVTDVIVSQHSCWTLFYCLLFLCSLLRILFILTFVAATHCHWWLFITVVVAGVVGTQTFRWWPFPCHSLFHVIDPLLLCCCLLTLLTICCHSYRLTPLPHLMCAVYCQGKPCYLFIRAIPVVLVDWRCCLLFTLLLCLCSILLQLILRFVVTVVLPSRVVIPFHLPTYCLIPRYLVVLLPFHSLPVVLRAVVLPLLTLRYLRCSHLLFVTGVYHIRWLRICCSLLLFDFGAVVICCWHALLLFCCCCTLLLPCLTLLPIVTCCCYFVYCFVVLFVRVPVFNVVTCSPTLLIPFIYVVV